MQASGTRILGQYIISPYKARRVSRSSRRGRKPLPQARSTSGYRSSRALSDSLSTESSDVLRGGRAYANGAHSVHRLGHNQITSRPTIVWFWRPLRRSVICLSIQMPLACARTRHCTIQVRIPLPPFRAAQGVLLHGGTSSISAGGGDGRVPTECKGGPSHRATLGSRDVDMGIARPALSHIAVQVIPGSRPHLKAASPAPRRAPASRKIVTECSSKIESQLELGRAPRGSLRAERSAMSSSFAATSCGMGCCVVSVAPQVSPAFLCDGSTIDGCSCAFRARAVSRSKLLTTWNARTVSARIIARSKLLTTGNVRLEFESDAGRTPRLARAGQAKELDNSSSTVSSSATMTEFIRDGDGSRDMDVRETAGAASLRTGLPNTERRCRVLRSLWHRNLVTRTCRRRKQTTSRKPTTWSASDVHGASALRTSPRCRKRSAGRGLRRTCPRTGSRNCGSNCPVSRSGTQRFCRRSVTATFSRPGIASTRKYSC